MEDFILWIVAVFKSRLLKINNIEKKIYIGIQVFPAGSCFLIAWVNGKFLSGTKQKFQVL